MNIFIQELVKDFGDKKIILVLDGAGWHKSKNLIVPKNIIIKLLPPYCPELNPVERLWLCINQNTIRNKIYESITSLEDVICDFIKNLKTEEIKRICNSSY